MRRGLLNHYFGTKRDLFLQVVGEMLHDTTQPLWSSGQDLPREQLVAISVDEWLDLVESNSEMWFAILGAEGFGRDPELEQMLELAREATAQRVLDVLGVVDADATNRAVLRCYGALAEETSRQWLQKKRLNRAGAHTLLSQTLLALVSEVDAAVRAVVGAPEDSAESA